MSTVTWVLTANVLDTVDPVLLTRVRRFEIKRPDAAHVAAIVKRSLSGIDEGLADGAAEMVAERWRAEPRMTLRQVAALVERIGAAASGPRLH